MAFERDRQRERIVRAAEALLERDGTAALKARALAEASDVTVGTVYGMFGSMDRVLDAVLARAVDRLRNAAAGFGPAGGGDRRAALLGLAEIHLDFVSDRANVAGALLARPSRGEGHAAGSDYFGHVVGLVDAALRGTALDAGDAGRREAAMMVWSGVHGIVALNAEPGAAAEQLDAARRQIALLVDAVLGIETGGSAEGREPRVC